MNQLAVVIGFLAEAPERQVELLPSLPPDPGAGDFWTGFIDNPLLNLAGSYQRFLCQHDHESREAFTSRVGVSSASVWPSSTDELNYLLYTIKPADHTLWTQKALTRRVEWRVVRRLAAIVLADSGWSQRIDHRDITTVLARHASDLRVCWREEGQPWATRTTGDSAFPQDA